MDAFKFVKTLEYLPSSTEGSKLGRPSNSEIRRWLLKRSIVINGVRPLSGDELCFPIKGLIFFPSSKKKTTMVNEGETE